MVFRVGMKVVCVDADFSDRWKIGSVKQMPSKNGVYVVRDIGPWNFSNGTVLAIWLEEIKNPVVRWSHGGISEVGFSARRFRPIVERKTDISIFTRMLNPSQVDA